jgi:hypothetical protein
VNEAPKEEDGKIGEESPAEKGAGRGRVLKEERTKETLLRIPKRLRKEESPLRRDSSQGGKIPRRRMGAPRRTVRKEKRTLLR